MAKCKVCGKSGLFLKLDKNGKCKDCTYKAKVSVNGKTVVFDAQKFNEQSKKETTEEWLSRVNPKYKKSKNELEYQDKLLTSVGEAREQYNTDNDIDKLISVYEYALITSNPPLRSDTHTMYLADLYIKSGQNDKAWGYLNSILFSHSELTGKIRLAQCKILKKEKKYVDAMQMLMLSYLFNSKWNNTFRDAAFVKDATPIANKLKWDSGKIDILAQIISNQVKRKNYDEGALIKFFQKALSQFGL